MATIKDANGRTPPPNCRQAEKTKAAVPLGLCLECCDNVDLAICSLIDLRDGGRPLLGHLREGQLCGPVFDEAHLDDDVDGLGVLEFDEPLPN